MSFFNAILNNSSEVSSNDLNREFSNLLVDGEQIEAGYKVFRDVFLFTNKRVILVDKQGLTGKKVQYMSVAYKSISRFSVETAGSFDLDAELNIWVSGESLPSISKKFNNQVNVYEVQKTLARHVL